MNDLAFLQLENETNSLQPKKRRVEGIGSHHSARSMKDEWLTPPEIIKALGEFDLDPCAPVTRPWPTAKRHFTIENDGLAIKWQGRVWLNSPYGNQTSKWLERMATHNNGIALVFARTETKAWFDFIWPCAHAILFLRGRINFYHVSGKKAKGNSGAPVAIIAYGHHNVLSLLNSGIDGKIVRLKNC